MGKIILSDRAKNDLREITRFIAHDKPTIALHFARRIVSTIKQLRQFPQMGRMVPEEQDKNLRELIYGNYRIIYRLRDKGIEVLTIHHASRILKIN